MNWLHIWRKIVKNFHRKCNNPQESNDPLVISIQFKMVENTGSTTNYYLKTKSP